MTELQGMDLLESLPCRDVIERQLVHVEENSVRNVYNHFEYFPQRSYEYGTKTDKEVNLSYAERRRGNVQSRKRKAD